MSQSQAEPQSSSSVGSGAFGFGTSFVIAVLEAAFAAVLAPELATAGPADAALAGAGRGASPPFVFVDLVRPFGAGLVDLAFDCAASQPAKSGSPPSSKLVVGGAGLVVFEGASKNESSSSSIVPQAEASKVSSSASSKSGSGSVTDLGGSVVDGRDWADGLAEPTCMVGVALPEGGNDRV